MKVPHNKGVSIQVGRGHCNVGVPIRTVGTVEYMCFAHNQTAL